MNRMFGSGISYYAGKLERHLRYRGIACTLLPMTDYAKDYAKEVVAGAGVVRRDDVPAADRRRKSLIWCKRASARDLENSAGCTFSTACQETGQECDAVGMRPCAASCT